MARHLASSNVFLLRPDTNEAHAFACVEGRGNRDNHIGGKDPLTPEGGGTKIRILAKRESR